MTLQRSRSGLLCGPTELFLLGLAPGASMDTANSHTACASCNTDVYIG